MVSFKVYIGSKEIDQVFYNDDFLKGFKSLKEVKESVKKSLVDHDGYNPNIWLKASK